MSHYKPYPAYKDSGVEWLGKVPEHWAVGRLKQLLVEVGSGGTPDTDNSAYWSDSDEGIPWVAIGDISGSDIVSSTAKKITAYGLESKRLKIWPAGTLLFSMYASLGHTAELAIASTTNQAILCLVPNKFVNQRYLLWWLEYLKPNLREQASSNTQDNLNAEKVRNLVAPHIPLAEQRAIAAHLDRETARIDALVEKKTSFIELLLEKRQALITHAVTKGLDPKVKMKDSGVEWLGEVPEHWEVAPMKYVCDLLKDGTHLPPPRTDDGVPLLSVRNIIDGKFMLRDDDSTISYQNYIELCKAFTPKEGDVLLAVVGATLGKTALIPSALGQFHIQRSLAIFRPHPGRMDSRWLHLIFQSSLFQDLLWEHAGYSAQPGIYLGALSGFSIPQPPLDEQVQMFAYLSECTSRIDSIIRTTERSIELLRERRSALITAAVTGQIDLREAA